MNYNPVAFKTYLEHIEKLSPTTIHEHLNNLNRFVQWAKEQTYTELTHLTYTELLLYVKYNKDKQLKTQSIQTRLNSLKKYYDYLKHIGLIESNPTKKIKLKGQQHTITQNLFSYTELEQLYTSYLSLTIETKHNPLSPYSKQKNNVVLGLLLWQGITSGELAKLTLEHVNLDKATIYIPKVKRGAARELNLFTNQTLQLYKYIHEARPYLKPQSNELIPGSLKDNVYTLLQQLKGIQPKLRNTSQIRSSIIIHWIKVYGKRKTQYLAGHKYVSSTEHYQSQEIDSLTDLLTRHHPFA